MFIEFSRYSTLIYLNAFRKTALAKKDKKENGEINLIVVPL